MPVRALLLAGTIDPVTPPAFADDVARGLPSAEALRVRGQAHGVLFDAPRSAPLRRVLDVLR